MARTKPPGVVGKGSLKNSLERLSERLGRGKSLRSGHIVFQVSGSDGGNFHLQCSEGQARLVESSDISMDALPRDGSPLIEVIGEASRIQAVIQAVLSGEKDATKHFYAGGFRIRGNPRYLSDIALELGVIKQPL
jgi:hypothetical protein